MKKILLLTDGSAYSAEAAKYALWLGSASPVSVTAVYLTDLRQFEIPLMADIGGSLGAQPYADLTAHLRQFEEQKAKLIGEQVSKALGGNPAVAGLNFQHKTGTLTDCLAQYEPDTDLVVVGKRGENANFETEHLGSNLERVLRSSTKPCLVTNRAFREIKRIAIAYDNSLTSQKAVRWVCSDPAFKRCAIHMVTVAEGGREDEASQALRTGEAIARDCGVTPTCQVIGGVLEASITNYVDTNAVDLLVMGAYGHSRIRYLLIGSATTSMIRSCKIPVLCVR